MGPWRNESGQSLPLGQSSGGDHILHNSSDDRSEPWRLILYKTIPGAFECSTEESSDYVAVVPRAVNVSLKKKLEPESSTNFPVQVGDENQSDAVNDLQSPILPEEPVGDDNVEPDSEEEQEPPPNTSFVPTEQ